jgi:hypothetical protein
MLDVLAEDEELLDGTEVQPTLEMHLPEDTREE